jgi:hypothetical protein
MPAPLLGVAYVPTYFVLSVYLVGHVFSSPTSDKGPIYLQFQETCRPHRVPPLFFSLAGPWDPGTPGTQQQDCKRVYYTIMRNQSYKNISAHSHKSNTEAAGHDFEATPMRSVKYQ